MLLTKLKCVKIVLIVVNLHSNDDLSRFKTVTVLKVTLKVPSLANYVKIPVTQCLEGKKTFVGL